jgi:hypothetical protein
MDLTKPSNLAEKRRQELAELKARHEDVTASIRCLVSMKGYGYARSIANQIAKEFECKPTDPNWQVYTTVKWSIDKLFAQLEDIARTENKTPKEEMAHANNRRNRKPTGTSTGASRRRL